MDSKLPWALTERGKKRKREYNKEYFERMYEEDYARYLFKAAKARAKIKNLEFSITKEDIVIPEYCPILGIKLQKGKGRLRMSSPTLDRKDNTKGYTPSNIAVISNLANTRKGDLNVKQVERLLEYMRSN